MEIIIYQTKLLASIPGVGCDRMKLFLLYKGILAEEILDFNIWGTIMPALIAAMVSLLGIFAQLYIGKQNNKYMIESIKKTKEIESYIQFYRPFCIYIDDVRRFFENNEKFEFSEEQAGCSSYQSQLKELQILYKNFLEWFEKNLFLMYPENQEIEKEILFFYRHMQDILLISEEKERTWKVLQKYSKQDIFRIIHSLNDKINKIDL